jgi:hypothetical protein
MLVNVSSERLEERSIKVSLERIKVLESHKQTNEIPFTTMVRYGKRPTLNEYDGALHCRGLELLFLRPVQNPLLIKPLNFVPELIIDVEGFPEFSIVTRIRDFKLSEGDALLLAVLENFARKATINLFATGKEPLLYLDFNGQESEIVRLNTNEATWLLQA